MRGRISPKVMAMIISNAVAPLVATLVSRAAGALGPIETNSTRPIAALNRKKPARQRLGARCFPFQIGQLRCAVQEPEHRAFPARPLHFPRPDVPKNLPVPDANLS
jgi:hypothetical protein